MISEEVTEANIKKLIEKIPSDATPLEKVILANTGTVQTLLSVVFNIPIRVEVIAQTESDSYIVRWVRLLADYGSDEVITVALAESIIDKKTDLNGFLTGIREKSMGIGQLLSACCIKTERTLLGFYCDKNVFSRTYNINMYGHDEEIGRDLNITITEVFQKEAFRKLEKPI